MNVLLQIVIHGIVAAGVYVLIASGLSFIYATTRVFHLAHGGVIAFSAYVFWWLQTAYGFSLWVSALGAVLAAAALGLLMNELVYEPLRRRRTKGLGYLIATIALLLLTNASLIALWGAQTHSLNLETPSIFLGEAHFTILQLILVVVAFTLLGLLVLLSRYTRFGKAMRATADNELMATVLGVNTRRVRQQTFLIGSLLGGVAGIFLALEFNLEPNMGVMVAIRGFTAAVIGGVGSIGGAVVGSFLLGGIEQAIVWVLGATWKNSIAFVLLLLFLLVKPTGVFGTKRYR